MYAVISVGSSVEQANYTCSFNTGPDNSVDMVVAVDGDVSITLENK